MRSHQRMVSYSHCEQNNPAAQFERRLQPLKEGKLVCLRYTHSSSTLMATDLLTYGVGRDFDGSVGMVSHV